MENPFTERSPQCPLDGSLARLTDSCEADDFGLVGMKIASDMDQPGVLDYDATTREEIGTAGTYAVVFAVQNFSTDAANTDTDATVEIYRDNVLVDSQTVAVSLAAGTRGLFAAPHRFEAVHEYRVEVELDSDDFTEDNTKSMVFRVEPPTVHVWPEDLVLGELVVRSLDPDSGRWSLTGPLPRPRKPLTAQSDATVEFVVFPRRAVSIPQPVVRELSVPVDHPGWREGAERLTYRATEGQAPRVLELELGPGERRDLYALRLVIDDPQLEQLLADAATTTLRVTFSGSVSIYGVHTRVTPPLLKVDPANVEEDAEEEP